MHILRGLIAALLLVAVLPASAVVSKKQQQAPLATPERLMEWINSYRFNPEPDRLPAAVRAMRELGLVKDIESSGLLIGFIAGVLWSNPQKAEKYVAGMFPIPPEEQPIVIKAIAFSRLPDWKGLMAKFVERMPARRVMIEQYMYDKAKPLFDLPLEAGIAPIDTLWGYYFATGAPEPVQRIISALQWTSNKDDLDKLTAGSMAKWTLASNALRDKDLRDLFRFEAEHQPKEVAAELKDIILAAEMFETSRIRKEALAKIDELKVKGPVKQKTWWQWAANAAPTAVGLACVAASAAGQVEFGIPCIVTGVATSAGSKYLNGQ